jgi:hypothetical protein
VTYDEAREEAQGKANRLGRDVGIERVTRALGGGFMTFLLPRPEKRFGHELTCEVVHPSGNLEHAPEKASGPPRAGR